MNRVRWLSATWPVSMRTLGTRMKGCPFTPDSFDGFVVERIRDHSIEARFIEKITYSEVTIDPFGNEETFQRTAYRSVNFTLSSEFPHIEIKDSPKSTKDFVNKLLELCNFSLAVTPISVNLFDWVNEFQKSIARTVIVDSIQLSDLELAEGVSAKVLLKGGRDVRDAVFHLAQKKKYHLDKLQVKVKIDEKYASIHLSNAGAATIPSDLFEELLPLLRASLPTPARSKQ